jgi:hypothetical protein
LGGEATMAGASGAYRALLIAAAGADECDLKPELIPQTIQRSKTGPLCLYPSFYRRTRKKDHVRYGEVLQEKAASRYAICVGRNQ